MISHSSYRAFKSADAADRSEYAIWTDCVADEGETFMTILPIWYWCLLHLADVYVLFSRFTKAYFHWEACFRVLRPNSSCLDSLAASMWVASKQTKTLWQQKCGNCEQRLTGNCFRSSRLSSVTALVVTISSALWSVMMETWHIAVLSPALAASAVA